MIALSIRQPYAELILRGIKQIEYRSQATRKRERVYIYASRIPAADDSVWQSLDAAPGDFPTGVLVGTVEIVDCRGVPGDFEWQLSKPERLSKLLSVRRKPQPMFFHPF
jgi:hypothetical protein